ncbi:RNA polymerase sigma factor [uncultured Herbaspirillum sp.]|uniref:RNA polymerase sigma factor n=1 Tax=uncultured Herbaspirillum sp. TaxID=160236 RepID=UPI00258591BD|nr:RNA polymerase sigma factor [uncultured Herbaspirillum sp.]
MKIDPQLAHEACRGNPQALDLLLARMEPDLKRFARRTCATSEDADDAVQEALWKFHKKFNTIQKLSALAAWMFRIIERECYRLFSRPRRLQELTPEQQDGLPARPLPLQLRGDLVAALASLAPHYREILILRDIEELSAPEAAAYLNISVAAVKSRLHRARSLMRERLIAGGYSDLELIS